MITDDLHLDDRLKQVRTLLLDCFSSSSLNDLVRDNPAILASGKMLRSRLVFRVGTATGADPETLVYAATAVEMIHAASLIHDDVIDEGRIRRGAPAFWVERGVPAAILLGDFLLIKSMDIICRTGMALAQPMVTYASEMCMAESEQELIQRGGRVSWNDYVRVARSKTGSLFAFAGYACAQHNEELGKALAESGYRVGTAYQLADDILDAVGSPESSGKTLGTDDARKKITAMNFVNEHESVDPVHEIKGLCREAEELLAPWPEVREAWNAYMERDMGPGLQRTLGRLEQ